MLYIYGAGMHGVMTYYKLKYYGVKVDGFIDKNKSGYIVDGLKCIKLDAFLLWKTYHCCSLVIGIKDNIRKIVDSLHDYGLYKVYTFDDYLRDNHDDIQANVISNTIKDERKLFNIFRGLQLAVYEGETDKLPEQVQHIYKDYLLRNDL